MLIVVLLPAPLGPRKPKTSPGGDGERDAADGVDVAVGLDEVVDLDGGWEMRQSRRGRVTLQSLNFYCRYSDILHVRRTDPKASAHARSASLARRSPPPPAGCSPSAASTPSPSPRSRPPPTSRRRRSSTTSRPRRTSRSPAREQGIAQLVADDHRAPARHLGPRRLPRADRGGARRLRRRRRTRTCLAVAKIIRAQPRAAGAPDRRVGARGRGHHRRDRRDVRRGRRRSRARRSSPARCGGRTARSSSPRCDGLLAEEDREQLVARLRAAADRAYDQLAEGWGSTATTADPRADLRHAGRAGARPLRYGAASSTEPPAASMAFCTWLFTDSSLVPSPSSVVCAVCCASAPACESCAPASETVWLIWSI